MKINFDRLRITDNNDNFVAMLGLQRYNAHKKSGWDFDGQKDRAKKHVELRTSYTVWKRVLLWSVKNYIILLTGFVKNMGTSEPI